MSDAPVIGIFLVDDDSDTLTLVQTILKNRGYRTMTAQDGEEALMRLTTDVFDLIISDVDMPNLDGLKLLELMRANGIKTPLIFLTAGSAENAEKQALERGAAFYLKKPVKKDVLMEKVAAALAKPASS
ncbi:MAG: response regulator [Elusimicrobiales bacterium]|nr:response regulator [Elusimicrobiales bacterium]